MRPVCSNFYSYFLYLALFGVVVAGVLTASLYLFGSLHIK